MRKLDASFSIVTADAEQMRDALPTSAADLLKIVPGLWVESAGGQTGANIEVAGFPGGGDAPFVTYQLNGSPLFPMPSPNFMDNSSLFRFDDSIERVEVLQGGPSVVLSNGQIGATANFLLREGTAIPHGTMAVTLGSEGMYRLDGFYGASIAPGWFYSVGGFFRQSDGVRNPQFLADNGGQITITLSRKIDTTSVLIFVRELDDKNLFVTDVPLTVSADGKDVSAFPGFNPLTGTFAGDALRSLSVEEFPGNQPGKIDVDLASGRGARLHMVGLDIDTQVGAVTVSNKASYMAGNIPTTALFNNLSPTSMGTFIAAEVAAANLMPAVVSAAGLAHTGTATWAGSGAAVNSDTQVLSVGLWVIDKQVWAFTDELRLTAQLFVGNSITVGGYFADYASKDVWYLGNNLLLSATSNAQPINLVLDNGAVATQNGFLSGSSMSLVDHYEGHNSATFVSDQWRWNSWLWDAGWRIEHQQVNGHLENDSTEDLDNDPLTLYNNGTSVANGTWTTSSYDRTSNAWTAGVNYEINAAMSVYGRAGAGFHFPSFDDLRDGVTVPERIQNTEFGFRGQSAQTSSVVSVFHRRFTGAPYAELLADGSEIIGTYGSRGYGIDAQFNWSPWPRFNVQLTGDWQDSVYTSFTSATSGGDFTSNYDGSVLQRQPRFQFRASPSYAIPTSWGAVRVFGTLSYAGLRYSNPGDLQPLPQYYTLDGGLSTKFADGFELRLQGTNLTNQIGLTEGNGRVIGAGVIGGTEMARPIFGREAQLQLRYSF